MLNVVRPRLLSAAVAGVVLCSLTCLGAPAAAATLGAPVVSSLSVTSGAVTGHRHLTLLGSGFSGVTAVLFGGAKAGSVKVVSSHKLTLVVPAHKAGRVPVRVVTSRGASAVGKHDVYTYVAAPAVSSLSVSGGTAQGGTLVTVKGSGFTHVKKVLFGKAIGTHLHVLSRKTLTVVAPAHPAGRVDVRVVSAYGTSRAKPGDGFTFVAGSETPPPPPSPVITTTALPSAEVGQVYAGLVSALSGQPPYTFSATGLPPGLSLSSAGLLTGKTFVAAGPYSPVFTVTDSAGRTGTATLAVTVKAHAGQLFSWGWGYSGELGIGHTSMVPLIDPTEVLLPPDVVQGVQRGNSGYALRADGTAYSWGDNSDGQLGDGTGTATATPHQIPGLFGVVAIAAGNLDGYALKSDGTVMAWGTDAEGELGDEGSSDRPLPQAVPGLSHVVQLAAGQQTAYAVTSDGHVWAWGSNLNGQVGSVTVVHSIRTPTEIPGLANVRQVVSHGLTAYALLTDGTVVGWGNNADGEIGDGTTTQRTTPVPVPGLAAVTALAAGDSNGYAVLSDGTVRAWGINNHGQLGNGGSTPSSVPQPVPGLAGVVAIGSDQDTPFATMVDGSVSVWGKGELGNNLEPTTADLSAPTLRPTLAGMTGIGGNLATFAIR